MSFVRRPRKRNHGQSDATGVADSHVITPPAQALRLLLLDDDPFFATLLASWAKTLGMEVEWVASPLELDQIAPSLLRHRYDVLILDYDLGPVTGPEVSSYVCSLCGDIPIVVVSAHQDLRLSLGELRNVRGMVAKQDGCEAVLTAVRQSTRTGQASGVRLLA